VSQLRCFLDGNALCVVGENFINLQESEAIFIALKSKDRQKIVEFERRVKPQEVSSKHTHPLSTCGWCTKEAENIGKHQMRIKKFQEKDMKDRIAYMQNRD
jgi:hypothetical protein